MKRKTKTAKLPRSTSPRSPIDGRRAGRAAAATLAGILLLAACSDEYTGPDAQPYPSYGRAKTELAELADKYDGFTSSKPEGEMEAALRGALPLFISNTDKTAKELVSKFGTSDTVRDAETGDTFTHQRHEFDNGQYEDSFGFETGSVEDGATQWVSVRRNITDDSVVSVNMGAHYRSPDHFGEPIPYEERVGASYYTDGDMEASTFTRPISEADEDRLKPISYGGTLTADGFDDGRTASLESLQFGKMVDGMSSIDAFLARIQNAQPE